MTIILQRHEKRSQLTLCAFCCALGLIVAAVHVVIDESGLWHTELNSLERKLLVLRFIKKGRKQDVAAKA